MFRFTPCKFVTSPYFLFVHDVQKKNPVKGKGFQKKLSKMYQALSENQKAAYARRARSAKNPGREAFSQLQKKYQKKFASLPANKRSAAISALAKQKRIGVPLNVEVAAQVALGKAKVTKPVAKSAKKAQLKVKSKSKQVKTTAKKIKKDNK